MTLGPAHDDEILKALALSNKSTTRLAHEVGVDDGGLTQRLINVLAKEGLVEVVGADGNTPVWGLKPAGRERVECLGR